MAKRGYRLSDDEIKQFYRIYFNLLTFSNKKHGAVPSIALLDPVKGVKPSDVQKIRDALWADPTTVDEYLAQIGPAMPEGERAAVEGWRKGFIHDKFIVMKQLANYAVFMQSGGSKKALYGVTGLNTPIKAMFPKEALPLITETTLLPFLGRMISDSKMEEIGFFDELPPSLTYPDITKTIFPYALQKIRQKEEETIADLKLSEIMGMQKQLQDKHKGEWTPLTPEYGRSCLLWMVEELGEIVSIIKKRGETYIMADPVIRDAFIEEFVDVLMFMNDSLLCYGISASALSNAFLKKHAKNMNRDWKEEARTFEENRRIETNGHTNGATWFSGHFLGLQRYNP